MDLLDTFLFLLLFFFFFFFENVIILLNNRSDFVVSWDFSFYVSTQSYKKPKQKNTKSKGHTPGHNQD